MATRSSGTKDYNQRKRAREEARARERYDRLSATVGLSSDSTKYAARYPTRVVPNVPGMFALSKTEVKKDVKDAQRSLQYVVPCTGDFPPGEDRIMRSQRPPVHDESSLMHKTKRFKQWMANPASQKKELDFWNAKCEEAKSKFHELESQREEWNIHFEQSRKMCIETHQELSHGIRRLKRQAKHLFRLCENECAQGNTNGSGSGNKAFTNKDLIDELIRRELHSEKLKQQMKVLLEKQAVKVTLTEADCVMSSDFQLPITVKEEASLDKTSSSASVPAVKVEHSSTKDHESTPMDIDEEGQQDGEDDNNNNTVSSAADKRQIGKQLLSFLQQLNDYIARSESMEHDVEWFFLEQDDLTMIESLIQKEFGAHTELSSSAASTSSSHGNAAVSEEKMAIHRVFTENIIHENKDSKKKEDGIEDKDSHDHAALQRLLNKIFEAMDPVGTTTRKKKQRGSSSSGGNSTEPIMKMQTFARHRTEIGLPLILSAASCFEDRYIGVQKCETIFSPATAENGAQNPDGEKVYQVVNPTPLPLQKLEDDVMTRCQLQSEAAYTAEKIKKLQVQLIDLQKSLQDANHARNRALQIYRNVELEDMNERQRMKNNHIQYGLIPGPGPVDANNSSTSLGNTTSASGGGSSSSSPLPMTDAADNVAPTSMGLEVPPVPTAAAEELPVASASVANGKANNKGGKSKSRR